MANLVSFSDTFHVSSVFLHMSSDPYMVPFPCLPNQTFNSQVLHFLRRVVPDDWQMGAVYISAPLLHGSIILRFVLHYIPELLYVFKLPTMGASLITDWYFCLSFPISFPLSHASVPWPPNNLVHSNHWLMSHFLHGSPGQSPTKTANKWNLEEMTHIIND